jgi:hypothetical protein
MLERLRAKLGSGVGKGAAAAAVLIAVAIAVYSVRNNFGGQSSAARLAAERVYICAETGKQFEHTMQRGDEPPILSPHSGKRTGWEAERCFWTADGKVKDEPTFVLLNKYKGEKGPTFCSDCGRVVVQLNPAVHAGSVPPPTRDEYAKARGAKGANAPLPDVKQDE